VADQLRSQRGHRPPARAPPPPGLFGIARLAEDLRDSVSLCERQVPIQFATALEAEPHSRPARRRRLFTSSPDPPVLLLPSWQAGAGRCDGRTSGYSEGWSPDAGATRVRSSSALITAPGWSAFAEPAPGCPRASVWLSSATAAGSRHHRPLRHDLARRIPGTAHGCSRSILPMPAFPEATARTTTASADSMEAATQWLFEYQHHSKWLHGRDTLVTSTKRMVF